MPYPIITLRPAREVSATFHHPWIFSGAIDRVPVEARHGALVYVADSAGKIIGTGTYSARSSIAVRLLDFTQIEIDWSWIANKLREADARRQLMGYGVGTDTTGYRVAFGEADGLPGLVVDRYGDAAVFQLSTAGMDALRDEVVAAIHEALHPVVIVERSDMASRLEEGLVDRSEVAFGILEGNAKFLEHGLTFSADLLGGQKTGFFLDQKDLRSTINRLAKNRKGLNMFSYTGASAISAMLGGAVSMHNVDASQPALDQCAEHAKTHGIAAEKFTTECIDAFQYFGAPREDKYDLIVLDPPALIKSAKDAEDGKKAYHFLNRAALRMIENGGIFITSSCSHFLSEDDFAFLLRRASLQAGVRLDILQIIRQSPDHPQSIYFPESAYLKSFVCLVTK